MQHRIRAKTGIINGLKQEGETILENAAFFDITTLYIFVAYIPVLKFPK